MLNFLKSKPRKVIIFQMKKSGWRTSTTTAETAGTSLTSLRMLTHQWDMYPRQNLWQRQCHSASSHRMASLSCRSGSLGTWTPKNTSSCWIKQFCRHLMSNMDMETTFSNKMAPPATHPRPHKSTWSACWDPRDFGSSGCGPQTPQTWMPWISFHRCEWWRGPALSLTRISRPWSLLWTSTRSKCPRTRWWAPARASVGKLNFVLELTVAFLKNKCLNMSRLLY